jgi:hypothetical protein
MGEFANEPCSGGRESNIWLSDDGGSTNIRVRVLYTDSSGYESWVEWEKTFSGRVDCGAWTDEPIPYSTKYDHPSGSKCNYGSPINDILVTSVP